MTANLIPHHSSWFERPPIMLQVRETLPMNPKITRCCRCKHTISLKTKEGSLMFKNYKYTTNLGIKRNGLAPLYFYNVSTLSQQHTFRSCYDSKIRLPSKISFVTSVRHLQTSNAIYFAEPNKPSSKVEETTEAIKEKAKEVIEKKPEMQVATPAASTVTPVVKKPLRQRIMDEIYHYYHGFRLLFIDIRVSSVLVWKVLKGGTLSRREYNLLIRTVGDMFRLVPFSIFIIVPFMEFLLPVFIKLFPGMLPSTFQTATEKISVEQYFVNIKQELSYRKPLPILRQRSKSSGLVDNVIAESRRPKTSLKIVPISKISNSRGADQKYKLNCNGKAIMYRAKNLNNHVMPRGLP
ncbi:letm1 and EF-hand domain-containing protein 1, mitochondrial [Homalodisca vitripennis]|nr:letm1 and EF-hand domain-containing protein 1, mitochondrial [Homalodisca vitripennis]